MTNTGICKFCGLPSSGCSCTLRYNLEAVRLSESFTMGDLTVEREPKYPYFWLVKRGETVLDRDQYSNDIRSRYEMGIYSNTKSGGTHGSNEAT